MGPGKRLPFGRGRPGVKILAVCVLSLVLLASMARIPQPARVQKGDSLAAFTDQLHARIPGLMDIYGIPGACIALLTGGQTVWTHAYGYADLDAKREMTEEAYLRVQSLSKPVTAWGVIKLAEQGKIALDEPVMQYIKDWSFPPSPFSAERVTVRQLLSHCAGLPLGDVFQTYSPHQAMPTLTERLTAEAVLINEPGARFSYSNTGYNLLELLIQQVTGCDFAEYMRREVLLPLGMDHATFVWSGDLQPPVPLGYDLSGKAVPVYVYPERGSGGLFASAGDMAAFVAAGMKGSDQQVLSPESIAMMYTPAVYDLGLYSLAFDAYGMGCYLENLPGGERAISHGGQGTGWMTHFHAVPETGDGIVILTNSQRSWPFIACLLSDWAKWSGLPPPGMSRIIWGEYALWALTGAILFIALWQAWGLAEGLLSGTRRFAPLKLGTRCLRLAKAGFSIALLAGLIWCAGQRYLFLSSVFPGASSGLAGAAGALAVVLLLSAFTGKDVYHGSCRVS